MIHAGKIIVGNTIFAALVYGWYVYVDGNRDWAIAGAVLAFVSMMIGTVVGYALNRQPPQRPTTKSTIDPNLLKQIE